MESFGNLGYTLGGNIQPGSGTAKFGYSPNAVNPPSLAPQFNNRSPYGQTSSWNGWQYNPGTMNPNNNQGPTFNSNNNNNSIPNNSNGGFSVDFSQQNQNQGNMDWRNIQSGSSPQYQPVTTTGPSSFQFRDAQQMTQSYQHPYNINSYNNNTSNNTRNNRNMPNNNNNMMGHYGQGAASIVPTNPNPFGNNAIPAIIEEKPLQCHVKLGDQGQQPIVYVGGVNPNEKDAQNYNINNGNPNGNNNQVQYNHSAGEPQLQIPQTQQHQMQANHCDTTQMMNQINTQIQNHNQHQQLPQQQQMGQMIQGQVQSMGQLQGQGQGQGQRNTTTPCGCCAACRAQMSNKVLGANHPQIVRGPKVQPRPNMMKTVSAPQMTVPMGENQLLMMQQQPQQQLQQMPQQDLNNIIGNQGDINPAPMTVSQVPQMHANPITGNNMIPVPMQQHQHQHQQHRQPFLS